MKEVLLSVTAAAILCSFAVHLTPEGKCRGVIRLTAALVMTAVVLQPLSVWTDKWTLPSPELYRRQAELAAAQGEQAAENFYRSFIEKELESYIVEQGARIGIQLIVQLTLNDQGIPEYVTVTGRWSEDTKKRMEEIIRSDLGIPPEKQVYLEEGG